MSTAAVTPDQLAKYRLFNGTQNPLFGMPTDPAQPTPAPAATPGSAMPQPATPTPSPAPSAPPSGAATLYGQPAAKPPMSEQDFAQSSPDATKAFMPTRPVGDFDTGEHPALRHALASLFAGMAEFGRPGAGIGMAERWNDQAAAQRQYDNPANQEKMKAGALNQAYQNYLTHGQEQSGIEHEQAETQNLAQNLPAQEKAAQVHDELVQRWQNNVDPDENSFFQFAQQRLAAEPFTIQRRLNGDPQRGIPSPLQGITQLPRRGPNFTVKDGTIEPLSYRGQSYGLQPATGEPAEVSQARQTAVGSLQAEQLAKLDPIIRGQLGDPPRDPKALQAYMKKAEQIKTRMAAAPRLEMVMSKPVEVADQSGNVHYEKAGQAMSDGSMAPQSAQTKAQVKNLENFTSGGASTQLTAINTAREHMKTFSALADALDNNDTQALNKIGNAFGVQFGNDKATNFKIAAQAFGGEVGKAFDGAGVTEGERKSAQSAFNPNMSPQQFRGAIRTVDSLLAGKQKSLQSTYDAGRQGKPNFGSGETGRTQQAPAGATHIVPGPDGRNHYTNAQGTVDLGVAP